MDSLIPDFLYWIGLFFVAIIIVYALPWIILRTVKDIYQQSGNEDKLMYYLVNTATLVAYLLIVITFLIFNLKYIG